MAPLVHALAKDPDFEAKVCVTAQHREMLDQVLNLFPLYLTTILNIMQPSGTNRNYLPNTGRIKANSG